MSVADDIIAARSAVRVRCGILMRDQSLTVSELAREFGLYADAVHYSEIDLASAVRLVRKILQHEMAYGTEQMPEQEAAELADRFFSQFGAETRYFSNGEWHLPGKDMLHVTSWNPVTDSVFDTGVLAVGEERSGCLWIEDED